MSFYLQTIHASGIRLNFLGTIVNHEVIVTQTSWNVLKYAQKLFHDQEMTSKENIHLKFTDK